MRRSQRSSLLRCFVCHAVPVIASTDPRASRWEPIRRQEPARRSRSIWGQKCDSGFRTRERGFTPEMELA
jgi:hypothetical protein